MNKKLDIQLQLFQRIRDQVPDHVSLVDEIADILEVSVDSAYRRIRGEKKLTLHEVEKLSKNFSFSVDDITGNRRDTVTFKANFLAEGDYSFADWLKHLLKLLKETGKHDDSEIMLILNELSIFQIIQIPEVFAFKIYFWQKSNLDFPNYRNTQFSLDEIDPDTRMLLQEIVSKYVKINTREFTTRECLNSYLKQVLYYLEAGYFSTKNDAKILCEKIHQLVGHLQKQAELGYKYPFGQFPHGEEGNFQLYYNDIILADNTVLVSAGEDRSTFITSNAINLMYSHNLQFFNYNSEWGRNLLSKSTLISGTAEKERNKFFLSLRKQIDEVAAQI
ncbi:MAG: hypothetical protein ABFS32_03235 [Bacteroidota bacterium]